MTAARSKEAVTYCHERTESGLVDFGSLETSSEHEVLGPVCSGEFKIKRYGSSCSLLGTAAAATAKMLKWCLINAHLLFSDAVILCYSCTLWEEWPFNRPARKSSKPQHFLPSRASFHCRCWTSLWWRTPLPQPPEGNWMVQPRYDNGFGSLYPPRKKYLWKFGVVPRP